jgi:hypothetical protein
MAHLKKKSYNGATLPKTSDEMLFLEQGSALTEKIVNADTSSADKSTFDAPVSSTIGPGS